MLQSILTFIINDNRIGVVLSVPAVGINLSEWLLKVNFSAVSTVLISVLAITWWLMKIYDQYITTRKRKKDELDNRK